MADKEPKSDPHQILWLVGGTLAVLIFLWFATGAYKTTDVKGLFIAPLPPVGSGESYGPQIGPHD
jgi:hypothetical protein